MRRFAQQCQSLYWDKSDYNSLNYYSAYYQQYPYIQNTEDCVMKVFESSLYIAQNGTKDDRASLLAISATFIFMIA